MIRQFKRMFPILWKNYINDFLGLFTGWGIIVLTLLAWLSFKDTSGLTAATDKFVVASGIGVGCVRNCMYNFGRTIFLFRNSKTLNKFQYVGVKKFPLIMSFILFNFLVVTTLSAFLILMSLCFEDQRETIKHINIGEFLLGYILMILMCQLIGYLAGMYLPNYEWIVVFGLLNYFFSIYLLGLGIPYNLIEQNKIIYVLGFFLLIRPAVMLMDSGWIDSKHLQFTMPDETTVHSFGYNNNINILFINIAVVVFVLSLIIVFISIKKYSFKKSEHLISINQYMSEFKQVISKLDSKEQIRIYLEQNSVSKYLENQKRK